MKAREQTDIARANESERLLQELFIQTHALVSLHEKIKETNASIKTIKDKLADLYLNGVI